MEVSILLWAVGALGYYATTRDRAAAVAEMFCWPVLLWVDALTVEEPPKVEP